MNAIAHASTAPAGPQLDNRRVLAGIVDLAIVLAGGFVLSSVLAFATGGEAGLSSRLVLIMVGWALYYYFAFESGDGQTVGKKLMKLRVSRVDGKPLEMRDVTLRTLLRLVDGPFVPLVGLIAMMATGERRQRLGDLVAGTMVVDASAEPAGAQTAAVAAPVAEPEAPTDPVAEPEAVETSAEPEAPAEPVAAEEPTHQGFAPPAPSPDLGEPAEATSPPWESPAPPESAEFDPYSLTQEPEPEADPVTAEPAVEEAPADLSLAPDPVAEEPVVEVPAVEEAPVDLSLAPDPVAEEPVVEVPAVEEAPADLSLAPEPVAEEPVVEEPVAEEPVAEESSWYTAAPVEEPPVEESPAEEPPVEESPAEEPEDAGPSPEESLAALMGQRPAAEETAAEETAADEPEDEVMTVRPMPTMSAIDMVMGEDEDHEKSPDGDDGREQPDPQ